MLLTFKGLSRLERSTRYWPMVISETLLCNMMQVTSRKKKDLNSLLRNLGNKLDLNLL